MRLAPSAGPAIAVAEMSLRKRVGARITIDGDPFVALFSETPGRVVVVVSQGHREEFLALAASHRIVTHHLGVTGGAALVVADNFEIQLSELADAHQATFPRLFAGTR